jgi:hypothetical protein
MVSKLDDLKNNVKDLIKQNSLTLVFAALQDYCDQEPMKRDDQRQVWNHLSELLGGCIIQSGESKL